MLCKFYLIIRDELFPLDKDCVKNWNEINYSIKRADYSGTSQSFTSQFEFVNAAYNLILNEYLSKYVYSEASISVHTIDNNHVYSEEFRSRLDFGTLKYTNRVLSINTFDDSLATLIKAKKGTLYEYKVSDVKDSMQLFYDRLMMTSKIEWIVGGGGKDIGAELLFELKYNEVPIYVETSEIAIKNIVEIQDVPLYAESNNHFFKNISDKPLNVNIKWATKITFAAQTTGATATLAIQQRNSLGELVNSDIISQELSTSINIITIDISNYKVESGCDLRLFIVGSGRFLIQTYDSTSLSLSFMEVGSPVNLNVVKPITLLNCLLKSMNDGNEDITCEIKFGIDFRLDNALLVPAESARGIMDAKLYSSYTKFTNWMNTMFGFVPVIEKNKVTFVPRESLYSDQKSILVGNSIDNFEYYVKDSLIYSVVRAGFEKKDYESVNGRDEFHWTSEYSTGVTIKENELELLSPYRADPYGIEFLVQKRGEDTTDSDSDNDVFFVCAELNPSKTNYRLVRSEYEVFGVISPETMFNSMYSPRSIIMANRRFIGISIDKLTFASSDGNSDVTINGVTETDEIVIPQTERLFTVGEVSFVSPERLSYDADVPIEVESDGKLYTCYISEKNCKYGRYDGVEHKLIVKSISNI